METLLQDVRYALRQLRRSPGFTLVAVLTLALGIGANTAIYSIIHGALRLPYSNSDRMVGIRSVYPQGAYFSSSYPDVKLWREQSKTLSPVVAMARQSMTWVGPARPELLNVNMVSEGYLGMYGLRAVVGRSFLPSEHAKGALPVCILSEKIWRKEFGGGRSVVGKTLDLNGKACTVVGVISEQVNNVRPAQVWMPLEPAPPEIRPGWNYLFTTATLRPGVTEAQALGEMRNIQAEFNRKYPENKHGIDIQPLSKAVFGNLRPLLFMLQAAVGFILLIACVNLANMLLARAMNRSREFGVRRALGASAGRMIRQTLTESLLLSFAGAVAGIAVAQALIHIPIAAWPKNFIPPASVHVDGAVLGFTALLAVGTGVLFGIIPALRIVHEDGKGALQQGRTVTESRGQNRTRAALVIAEIAFSMLLVAGALNMAFSFVRVLHTNPGMNPDKTLAMTISLSPAQYSK
ncbi:MAG: ABC transporter permease, partial [Acidobacteriaceae bacterium]